LRVLGLDIQTGGHAIAWYYNPSTNTYLLFEPNEGVYSARTLAY